MSFSYTDFEAKIVQADLKELSSEKGINEVAFLASLKKHVEVIDKQYKKEGRASGLSGYLEALKIFEAAVMNFAKAANSPAKTTSSLFGSIKSTLASWIPSVPSQASIKTLMNECSRAFEVAGLSGRLDFSDLKNSSLDFYSPEERHLFALLSCYCCFLMESKLNFSNTHLKFAIKIYREEVMKHLGASRDFFQTKVGAFDQRKREGKKPGLFDGNLQVEVTTKTTTSFDQQQSNTPTNK